MLGMVYNYLPFMILPLYSVMVKIDKSLIEAASDLGCNPVSTLFRVVVPLSVPASCLELRWCSSPLSARS